MKSMGLRASGFALAALGCYLVFGGLNGNALGAPMCPADSAPDRTSGAITPELVSKCVFTMREGSVKRGESALYNVYCPTRISQDIASGVGVLLQTGKATLSGGKNPILDDHKPLGLTPATRGTPHRYEYGCWIDGKPGVATHLKLDVVNFDLDARRRIADNCSFQGSQNGGIAVNAYVDREYSCQYPFRRDDAADIVRDVSATLLKRDLLTQVRAMDSKICLLPSTNIQCAPCTFSNKLVTRMQIRHKVNACPAGTTRTIQ